MEKIRTIEDISKMIKIVFELANFHPISDEVFQILEKSYEPDQVSAAYSILSSCGFIKEDIRMTKNGWEGSIGVWKVRKNLK